MKVSRSGCMRLLGLLAGSMLLLSGCVVRTYPLVKDRVDQDLSAGNRGYIQGRSPEAPQEENKNTRMTRVVEIELHPVIKFEKRKTKTEVPAPAQAEESRPLWGNRGEASADATQMIKGIPEKPTGALMQKTQSYKVEKGDTLQKISMKFYGTTKKWMKLFDANRDILKSPEKVYPGQILKIPLEPMQEPRENLK